MMDFKVGDLVRVVHQPRELNTPYVLGEVAFVDELFPNWGRANIQCISLDGESRVWGNIATCNLEIETREEWKHALVKRQVDRAENQVKLLARVAQDFIEVAPGDPGL